MTAACSTWIHFLTATTDGIGVGRGRTTVDAAPSGLLKLNSRQTDVVAGGHQGPSWHHVQNRWSASLAMSTDGSFPSRPRQLELGE
jgi:hypothetical protein